MNAELPPLHWVGAMQIDNASFQSLATEASVEARERILMARIAELEADRDSWKEQAEARVEDWAKEYERAKVLEADAERYRWLRSRVPGGTYRIMGVIYSEGGAGVDAAIDAAREGKA